MQRKDEESSDWPELQKNKEIVYRLKMTLVLCILLSIFVEPWPYLLQLRLEDLRQVCLYGVGSLAPMFGFAGKDAKGGGEPNWGPQKVTTKKG